MAVTVNIDHTSFLNVKRGLLKLAVRYQTPAVTRRIIRPAAALVVAGLRSTVPIGPRPRAASMQYGPLEKSIRILRPKRRTQRTLLVGAALGKNATGRWTDGYYYSFVDSGTKRSNRGGKGQRGQNIFNRGVAKSQDAALRLMVGAIQTDLKYINW